jgi:hypothetical protein
LVYLYSNIKMMHGPVNLRLQNLLQLDDPSFDELLGTVTPAVAERNTDVRQTVTLSVHPFR